jgi:hypothetical protein
MKPPLRLAAVALSLLCAGSVLAACGDDDETTTTTETVTSGATGGDGGATGAGDFQPERCPGADSPPNITNVTAYGANCAAVEDAMAKIGAVATRFKLGDFDCERTEGSELAGTWTCRGEATYFTFDFGD